MKRKSENVNRQCDKKIKSDDKKIKSDAPKIVSSPDVKEPISDQHLPASKVMSSSNEAEPRNGEHTLVTQENSIPLKFQMYKAITFYCRVTNTNETQYAIVLNHFELRDQKLASIVDRLPLVFVSVLDKVKKQKGARDTMDFTFDHVDLERHFYMTPRPIEKVTCNSLMEPVQKALDLNKDLNIVYDMRMAVVLSSKKHDGPRKKRKKGMLYTIKRNKTVSNEYLLKKRSILRVGAYPDVAIGIAYTKLCIQNEQTEQDQYITNVKKVLQTGGTTKGIFRRILLSDNIKKRRYARGDIVRYLRKESGISSDTRTLSEDIPKFEEYLNVNICVVSAELGDVFVRGVTYPDRQNIYIYNRYRNVYDVILSLEDFFTGSNFSTSCKICASDNCIETQLQKCDKCCVLCRNQQCLDRHKAKHSKKRKW